MNADNTTTDRPAPRRRRGVKLAGLVLVAAVGVSACANDPSALRVAKDIVNTLAESDAQRDCMLEKLDGYGESELEEIAKSANDAGPGTRLEQFEADLASCS